MREIQFSKLLHNEKSDKRDMQNFQGYEYDLKVMYEPAFSWQRKKFNERLLKTEVKQNLKLQTQKAARGEIPLASVWPDSTTIFFLCFCTEGLQNIGKTN